MSLTEVDDEIQLVEMLQEFCRIQRKEVEVFFDNAPAGQPRARNYGSVIARFVRQGTTADDAIRAKLLRLGKDARNWIVVSSDRAVQASAHAARAQVMPSDRFAQLLKKVVSDEQAGKPAGDDASEVDLKPEEIDDWMQLFQSKNRKRPG